MKVKQGILFLLLICLLFLNVQAQKQEVLLPVKVDKKWGYINLKGEMQIAPQFDAAEDFKGKQMAKATLNNKLVLVSRKGEIWAEPDVKQVVVLNEQYYAGSKDNVKWGVYKIPFKEVIAPQFTGVQNSADENLFYIFKNGYVGVLNNEGKIVIDPGFEKLEFHLKFFQCKLNDKFAVVNKAGKILLPAMCNQVLATSYNYLFFEVNSLWGCVNFDGDTILMPEYQRLTELSENFIKVKGRHEKVYVLSTGKFVFENYKGSISAFNDSLLLLQRQKLVGLGDANGNVLFQPQFHFIYSIGNNFFISRNDSSGVYQLDGKNLVPLKYQSITLHNDRFYLAKRNDSDALYALNGKLLIREGPYTIAAADGRIKVKSVDRIEVYKVDDNYNLEKDDEFINVITVSVSKKVEYARDITFTPPPPPPVVAGGGWFQNSKLKYGKLNKDGDTIVKAIFDFYREYPEKDLAIVGLQCSDPVKLSLSGFKYEYGSYVGLIQNSTGKFYARPDYFYIDVASIKDSEFVTTRAISKQGYFCFIFNGRKPISRKISFIDTASNGLMRFCEEGFLTIRPVNPEKANYLCTVAEFYAGIGVSLTEPRIGSTKLYLEGGKWGFWSVKHKLKILPQYQFASPAYDNRIIVKQRNLYGLIDLDNNIILNTEYAFIELLSRTDYGNFKVWKQNGNYGFINNKGESVVTPVYSKLSPFKEGFCVAINNGSSIFIDTLGDFLNGFLYQRANVFNEGLASVRTGNLWGFIDTKGKWVLPAKFKNAGSFGDGLAPVYMGNGWYYINDAGEKAISKHFTYAGNFVDGLARVKNWKGKYGYINTTGRYIIRPKYVSATDFDEYGMAKVKRLFGTNVYIHHNGNNANYFRFYKAGEFVEGRKILSKLSHFAVMDTTGRIVKKFKNCSKIMPYKNGYAVVVMNRKFGIIDLEGNYVIKPVYKFLSDVNEKGYMVFSNGHKRGVINLKGQIVLEAKYSIVGGCEYNILLMRDGNGGYFYTDIKALPINETHFQMAKPFSDGVAKVYLNNNWALLNTKGMLITNPKYGSIKKINPFLYKVSLDYFYGIVDTMGNFVIKPEFDYITLNSDNVFRVENGDQLGYIARNGKWIWKPRN